MNIIEIAARQVGSESGRRSANVRRRAVAQATDASPRSEKEKAIAPLKPASDPQLKLPAGFMPLRGGIWFNPKGEGTTPFHVCDIFDVVAETRDDFSKAWGLWLRWKDPDEREHNWAMPKALLAGDGGEIRSTLLDGGFCIAPMKMARTKFMELLALIKAETRARAVHSVGWNDGAFVLPDRTIGDTPHERVIYQGTDTFEHAYRCMGELNEWQQGIASYAIGNTRLAFALSAGFVGPLLALLGEEGGGINLRGPSSIGKSTALLAAGSIWGPTAFVRQWRATANGLEGVCVQHNETFLCLDELAQLDPREAGSVAYMIANGMGKARAGRSGSLRSPAQWKVFFLSSGELSLAELAGRDGRGAKRSAAGQEIRILDVEADAGLGFGLFDTIHDASSAEVLARRIKENAGKTYGTAGPAFVERMIARSETLASALKNDIDAFVEEHVPTGANGQVARAGRRFALTAAAGELAVRLDVLPWPEGEAAAACAAIFQKWLIGRGGVGAAEDREAIAKVRGFLEMHGGSRFEPVDADDEMPRIINRAGFWRDTENGREYLFLAEAWKTEVCAGMDAKRVAKVLAEQGLLRRDSGGKNSISVTLPGGIGKTRCYVVTAGIFEGEPNA
jgi:putative DNA primase/helicase